MFKHTVTASKELEALVGRENAEINGERSFGGVGHRE